MSTNPRGHIGHERARSQAPQRRRGRNQNHSSRPELLPAPHRVGRRGSGDGRRRRRSRRALPADGHRRARSKRLLGIQVPLEFGGDDASIFDVTDMCYALGRACSSTAMIFAMHQIKVACVVRHGRGNALAGNAHAPHRVRAVAARVLDDRRPERRQRPLQRGRGRARTAPTISLERNATVISYGAEADGIVTIARRAADAAGSDQVLLALAKDDYTLERSHDWDTLGMRGTCSTGFALKARGVGRPDLAGALRPHPRPDHDARCASVLVVGLGRHRGRCGRPRAAFIRKAARGANGQMPPGAAHFTAAQADRWRQAARPDHDRTSTPMRPTSTTSARWRRSTSSPRSTCSRSRPPSLRSQTVMSALRACGLSGYRNDGDFSVGAPSARRALGADHDQQRPHPRQYRNRQPDERRARQLARLSRNSLSTKIREA